MLGLKVCPTIAQPEFDMILIVRKISRCETLKFPYKYTEDSDRKYQAEIIPRFFYFAFSSYTENTIVLDFCIF